MQRTEEEIEKIDGMIAVLTAWKEGKQIEYGSWLSGNWETAHEPTWDFSSTKYRIKSEPKYAPYDNVAELEKDKWVKIRDKGILKHMTLTLVDPNTNSVFLSRWCTLKELFDLFTYEDGTPCGKKVEE